MRSTSGKHILDRRTVGRSEPDMMQPHDPLWVDQHVTALLSGIGPRHTGKPAPPCLSPIRPHRSETPEMAPPGLAHPISAVEGTFRVDKKRPDQTCLRNVLARGLSWLKGHDERAHVKPVQCPIGLLQLQQVSSTRQSEQVSMQHQQQPPTSVVIGAVKPTLGITQLKGYRWLADTTAHATLNSFKMRASSASALNRT